ncbi:hypothetical protein D3C73_661230 [compost metagenome]
MDILGKFTIFKCIDLRGNFLIFIVNINTILKFWLDYSDSIFNRSQDFFNVIESVDLIFNGFYDLFFHIFGTGTRIYRSNDVLWRMCCRIFRSRHSEQCQQPNNCEKNEYDQRKLIILYSEICYFHRM